MADLHWFPFFAKDWLSSPARMSMTPAQRGAYIDLLAVAWGNGDLEPSLTTDEGILAGLSGLGRDWKRLAPLILAQFDVRDGRYYNAKLSEVWMDAQDKHAKMVANGKKGGRPRKAKQKPGLLLASEKGPFEKATGNQSQSQVVVPTEPTTPPDALGPVGPRSAELPVDRDVRSAGWNHVKDTIRALPNLRAKPA